MQMAPGVEYCIQLFTANKSHFGVNGGIPIAWVHFTAPGTVNPVTWTTNNGNAGTPDGVVGSCTQFGWSQKTRDCFACKATKTTVADWNKCVTCTREGNCDTAFGG